MAKTLELVVQISSLMKGNFDDRFTKAAGQVEALKQKIDGLKNLDNAAAGFQNLSQRINNNNATIAQNKKQLETISNAYTILKTREAQLNKLNNALPRKARQNSEYAQELKKVKTELENLSREQKKLESQNTRLSSQVQRDTQNMNQMGESLKRAGIDTQNLASAQDKLQSELAQTTQAHNKLTQARERLQAARVNLSWGNIRGELMTAYASLQAFRAPLKISMDFEDAIARVHSAGIKFFDEDKKSLELLRKQAQELGASTKFTASESAFAQEQLIRGGFTPQDVLKSMPSLLNLAATEDIPLDQAAEIIVKTCNMFGYSADQAQRIGDVLANASVSSPANIPELFETLKTIGPLAKLMNMQIEDIVGLIAGMRANGIDASTAGTSIRSGLMRLAVAASKVQAEDKQQKQATLKAMQMLGVTIMTREGRMRRVEDIMRELNTQLNKYPTQKLALIDAIFGKNSSTGMVALMDASVSGLVDSIIKDSLTKARTGEGLSARRAGVRNNTLKGSETARDSAIQNLMIQIGDVFKPAAKYLSESATSIISRISKWGQENPKTFSATTWAGGAAAGYGAMKVIPSMGMKIFEYAAAKIGVLKAGTEAASAITAGGTAAETAITAGGTAAGHSITAGGTAAGGSLLAGAAAIGAAVGLIYMNYQKWKNMTREDISREAAATVISPQADRRTRDFTRTRTLGGRNKAGFTPHAAGGILTTPHIGLVAEAGPEAIIPLRDKPRGIQVLMQAANKLGILRESYNNNNNFMTEGSNNYELIRNNSSYVLNRNNSDNNIKSSPVINITVNANESESRDNNSLAEIIANKVREVIDSIANDSMRLSYA